MKKIAIASFILFLSLPIYAKVLITPQNAMKQTFTGAPAVTEKTVALNNAQIASIEKNSKTKLSANSIKIFTSQNKSKNIGYGVLLDTKIRSKNGVVLYMITPDGALKSIEIVAFNEPMEYIPSKKWIEQFQNSTAQTIEDNSKKAPAITGATLSAKIIIDGSKSALAIYDEVLKGK